MKALEELLQVHSPNQLHADEAGPLALAEMVGLDDVGMDQVGDEACLPDEVGDEIRLTGQLSTNDLDRNALYEAAGTMLEGFVHDAHAADVDLMDDLVAEFPRMVFSSGTGASWEDAFQWSRRSEVRQIRVPTGAGSVFPFRRHVEGSHPDRRGASAQFEESYLEIPRNRLVVVTGPSGSGKSSLAFDTLFAEGQRSMSSRCPCMRGGSWTSSKAGGRSHRGPVTGHRH